jgi:hypothetical protein
MAEDGGGGGGCLSIASPRSQGRVAGSHNSSGALAKHFNDEEEHQEDEYKQLASPNDDTELVVVGCGWWWRNVGGSKGKIISEGVVSTQPGGSAAPPHAYIESWMSLQSLFKQRGAIAGRSGDLQQVALWVLTCRRDAPY